VTSAALQFIGVESGGPEKAAPALSLGVVAAEVRDGRHWSALAAFLQVGWLLARRQAADQV
jgi:hypothetical protein